MASDPPCWTNASLSVASRSLFTWTEPSWLLNQKTLFPSATCFHLCCKLNIAWVLIANVPLFLHPYWIIFTLVGMAEKCPRRVQFNLSVPVCFYLIFSSTSRRGSASSPSLGITGSSYTIGVFDGYMQWAHQLASKIFFFFFLVMDSYNKNKNVKLLFSVLLRLAWDLELLLCFGC